MSVIRETKRRGEIEWHSYSCTEHGVSGFPGATTIINQKGKGWHFENWLKRQAAKAALRNLDALSQMVATSGEDAVIKFLAAAADKMRDDAGDAGTRVHAVIESIFKREPYTVDEDIATSVDGARRWLNANRPERYVIDGHIASEFMVVSESERYGATGDLLWVLDGELWLVDVKTSSGVYDTTSYQLAAIRWADHLGFGEQSYPMPPVTRFGVLHVRPEQTQLVPFDVRPDREWRAFLACRDLYEWDRERSREVIKEAI